MPDPNGDKEGRTAHLLRALMGFPARLRLAAAAGLLVASVYLSGAISFAVAAHAVGVILFSLFSTTGTTKLSLPRHESPSRRLPNTPEPLNLEPPMDTSTIIAGVSAALQAIQTWVQLRDRPRAASAFAKEYSASVEAAAVRQESAAIDILIPADVLEPMKARVFRCWDGYKDVIESGDYLPEEIDQATDTVKKCICRELRRIRSLNAGVLPPGKLQQWWDKYCVYPAS